MKRNNDQLLTNWLIANQLKVNGLQFLVLSKLDA